MNKEKKIKKELEELKEKRAELKNNEVVIDYLNVEKMIELKKCELQVEQIIQRKRKIDNEYLKMKSKYSKCYHYVVNEDKYGYTTCLFCGLTDGAKYKKKPTIKEEAMEKYIDENGDIAIYAKAMQDRLYLCDKELAMSIIDKIKKSNKGIKRDELIKYFEIALDNMIDIKVNNDRVESRAKRLGVKVTDIRKIRRGH